MSNTGRRGADEATPPVLILTADFEIRATSCLFHIKRLLIFLFRPLMLKYVSDAFKRGPSAGCHGNRRLQLRPFLALDLSRYRIERFCSPNAFANIHL